MKPFADAQKSFNEYQKNGRFRNLRDSLDILDEIAESQGAEFQRAISFGQIIERHVDTQLNEIWGKTNVDQYGTNLGNKEFARLLLEAMSDEDSSRFLELLSIQREYFGIKSKKKE